MCYLQVFSDISQILIAVANIILALYVFVYQKRRDKAVEYNTARLNEQNIKVQWFKDLVVNPNFGLIQDFYSELFKIRNEIISNDLSPHSKMIINESVKRAQARFRKDFVEIIRYIDKSLADEIMNNLDFLTDSITEAIFNDELKLMMAEVYEKNIGSKIIDSKGKLLSQLFNYKGLPS